MKKKLLLTLMVVMLFAVLTTVAMADGPIHQCHGMSDMSIPLSYMLESSEAECSWGCGNPGCSHFIVIIGIKASPVTIQHTGSFCEYCGWGTPTTETVTVSSTTAVVKTTTGQRLIVRDKADFSGKVLGYLDFGAKVEVLGVEGGFAEIIGNCGGKTVIGYVWSKDLHDVETITYTYEVEVPQSQPEPN